MLIDVLPTTSKFGQSTVSLVKPGTYEINNPQKFTIFYNMFDWINLLKLDKKKYVYPWQPTDMT